MLILCFVYRYYIFQMKKKQGTKTGTSNKKTVSKFCNIIIYIKYIIFLLYVYHYVFFIRFYYDVYGFLLIFVTK